MDPETVVRLNLGVIGGLLMCVGLFGLLSGRAYYPRAAPSTPTAFCQTAAGLMIATRPYW